MQAQNPKAQCQFPSNKISEFFYVGRLTVLDNKFSLVLLRLI